MTIEYISNYEKIMIENNKANPISTYIAIELKFKNIPRYTLQ